MWGTKEPLYTNSVQGNANLGMQICTAPMKNSIEDSQKNN